MNPKSRCQKRAAKQRAQTWLAFCVPMCVCTLSHFNCVWLFVTPWTVARQAHLSMGFSRQEYRSGLVYPPPGDLPEPGIKPMSPVSPALQADSLATEWPGKPIHLYITSLQHWTRPRPGIEQMFLIWRIKTKKESFKNMFVFSLPDWNIYSLNVSTVA